MNDEPAGDDSELKLRAQVQYMREHHRSLRIWLMGLGRSTVFVLVLFFGMWGLGVEPVTAARVTMGLWCMGTVAVVICLSTIAVMSGVLGLIVDAKEKR